MRDTAAAAAPDGPPPELLMTDEDLALADDLAARLAEPAPPPAAGALDTAGRWWPMDHMARQMLHLMAKLRIRQFSCLSGGAVKRGPRCDPPC